MRFTETPVEGARVVELDRREDDRGWFARTYDRDALLAQGIQLPVVQCSSSFNARAGTLRGMHLQRDPHGERKLVHCPRGAVFDVVVDLRPESPTHRRWFGIELSAENGRALFIPQGIAHGFQTLCDETTVAYLMGDPYVPEAATGVRWDDPAFGIEWPDVAERTMSDRDRAFPDYRA